MQTSTKQSAQAYPQKNTEKSKSFSAQLARLVPGGVNSPFRSFEEVGGHTIFFEKASGAKIYDVDGNQYIDYLGAWGPAVLGYAHPEIVSACQKVLSDGPVFGAPCKLELDFAELLVETIPSLEQVRFVNSGTEAVMSAVRLARGVTGRDKVLMFEGGYHGHFDSALASSKHASSQGIPRATAADTVLVEYNNLTALESMLEEIGGEVACVLVEPIAGSMNVVPPEPGFLEGLRTLCTKYEALLIFDEVLTGFRVDLGGAQALYGVEPDLTCFGKSLGGGMPIGVYGGPSKFMSELMPVGKVYQAGTFSGNPVTMAGGIATIGLLHKTDAFRKLAATSAEFVARFRKIIERNGYPVQVPSVNAMFGIAFSGTPVKNYTDSLTIDTKAFAKFFHLLLSNGVYLPPSAVDAACLSSAHSADDIDRTIAICEHALQQIW